VLDVRIVTVLGWARGKRRPVVTERGCVRHLGLSNVMFLLSLALFTF
jgi:hypothetical protein